MKTKQWKRVSVIISFLALAAIALSGCSSGSDGAAGATGATGPAGPAGAAGADKTTGTVSAAQFSFNDLKDVALGGKILGVDLTGDQPKVSFQVVNKNSGEGVRGLRIFALHIAQLQPEKSGSASYWLNYIADGLPVTASKAYTAAPINPTSDAVSTFNADGTLKGQGYSVVDNGDGTYVVTFGANIKANTKVVFDDKLVHRVVVGVRSVAVPGNYRNAAGVLTPTTATAVTAGAYGGPVNPLTNTNFAQFTNTNGANLIWDFTPSGTTGTVYKDAVSGSAFARDIVSIDACNACHFKIQYGVPRGNNTSGHFGSRTDTKTCVMCHTPQLTAGKGNMTTFIHKIHAGEELPAKEALFWDATANYNDMKYAQSIKNCASCHKGATAKSEQKFTQVVCGSCHNNINFVAGTGHRAQPDDSKCSACHDSTEVVGYHMPVVPPNPDNRIINFTPIAGTTMNMPDNANTHASWVAAAGVTPTGATKVTYVISSVSRNAAKQPVIVFKFQKKGPTDTVPVDVTFNTYVANGEMMDNFVGSPSIYFAWSVPQDGITAPADYNVSVSAYLKNLWRGDGKDIWGTALSATSTAKGTLTGPVAGYYTVTLTNCIVPDSAKMLTGGVGYSYGLTSTPPLVQTNLTQYPYTAATLTNTISNVVTTISGYGGKGGLSVPAPNAWKVATGYTGRRVIVDNAKCNACHGALGVAPTYHAGQRNDAPTCTFCHTGNRTNSGWPVNINYDVHALHGASLRTKNFSWEASAGLKYWTVAYPAPIKNCEMCHVAGFYDYTNAVYTSTTASVVPNLLMTTAASGTLTTVGAPASSTPGDTRVIASITTAPVTTGTYNALNLAMSPYVVPGTAYGLGFAWNSNTGVLTNEAAATTLVLSPISAACSGCHDSAAARAHMQAEGGTVFEARAVAGTRTEQCLVCHGPSANVSFNETVPAIKTVHRWW